MYFWIFSCLPKRFLLFELIQGKSSVENSSRLKFKIEKIQRGWSFGRIKNEPTHDNATFGSLLTKRSVIQQTLPIDQKNSY